LLGAGAVEVLFGALSFAQAERTKVAMSKLRTKHFFIGYPRVNVSDEVLLVDQNCNLNQELRSFFGIVVNPNKKDFVVYLKDLYACD
jgi:hypothetical protein